MHNKISNAVHTVMSSQWNKRKGLWELGYPDVTRKKAILVFPAGRCNRSFSCPSDFWEADSDGYFRSEICCNLRLTVLCFFSEFQNKHTKLWHRLLGLSVILYFRAEVCLLILKFAVSSSQDVGMSASHRCSAFSWISHITVLSACVARCCDRCYNRCCDRYHSHSS